MSNKLFLWEFLISKIKFDLNVLSVPTYGSISFKINTSHQTTDIKADECPLEGVPPDFRPGDGEFVVQMGKTTLFSATAEELQINLKGNSLLMDVLVLNKKVASFTRKWPAAILEFVKQVASSGRTTESFVYDKTFDFANADEKKIVFVDMKIKLVFVGENIETYFSFRHHEPIFMNPKSRVAFSCNKDVAAEGVPSFMPMAPFQDDDKVSWIGIFERPMPPDAISVAPFGGDGLSRASAYWDKISVKFKPDDNKFIDTLKTSKRTKFAQPPEGEKEGTELTSEKIMRKLCKNPACPAAKKFKDYGLGPLATGAGLGTMYKKVQPTKTYRLSNTYGVFTNYGPYGVFAKSKLPFFPPQEIPTDSCPVDFPCASDDEPAIDCSCPSLEEQPPSIRKSSCSCRKSSSRRLRGGEEGKIFDDDRFAEVPLRLRGGSAMEAEYPLEAFEYEFALYKSLDSDGTDLTDLASTLNEFGGFVLDNSESWRLRGGGKKVKTSSKCEDEEKPPMKSPMEECKSVMIQFDEILTKYKNALGPCGEATCPFSQNVCDQYCKKICKANEDPCPCVQKDSCIEKPCDIDECPFKEKPPGKLKGGCGSPKCPYAQYKLGLVTDDAELELAYLPPPIRGKCGDPKCEYPPQFLALPPIHWDCPDPLPQGSCKNPNCPHQPAGLRELKVPPPSAPCGSACCPYALPPPCDLPSCPFKEKPCPFRRRKKAGEANPTCSSSESEDDDGACCNPECPFSGGKQKKPSKPKCPPPPGCCPPPPGCCPPPPGCCPPPPGCCPPPPGCCPSPPGCCTPPRCCPPSPGCCPKPPGCPPPPGCCPPPPGCCPKPPGCCPKPPGCPPPPGCCPKPPGCPPPPGCCPKPPGCPPPPGCCPKPPGCPPPPGCKPPKGCKPKPIPSGCSVPCCPEKKKPGCCCEKDNDSEESFCDSPECPLNVAKRPKGTGCLPKPTSCENPECPSRAYQRHKKKDSDDELICDNDDCPYREGMGNRDDDDVCANPLCPYNDAPKKNQKCANPNCPFAGAEDGDFDDFDENYDGSICSNADCPFQAYKNKKKSDACDNPCCPQKGKLSKETEEVCNDCTDLLCNNPDCPNFKPPTKSSGPQYCDNPVCPFSKEYQTSVCVDPFCPYAQPLPSCGIPNCPYEKKPIMFCPSPICPSKFPKTPVESEAEDKPPAKPSPNAEDKKKKERRDSGTSEKQQPAVKSIGTDTKSKKGKSSYAYELGDQWPGVKIGHKECLLPYFRVPQKMGWMWCLQQPYFRCKARLAAGVHLQDRGGHHQGAPRTEGPRHTQRAGVRLEGRRRKELGGLQRQRQTQTDLAHHQERRRLQHHHESSQGSQHPRRNRGSLHGVHAHAVQDHQEQTARRRRRRFLPLQRSTGRQRRQRAGHRVHAAGGNHPSGQVQEEEERHPHRDAVQSGGFRRQEEGEEAADEEGQGEEGRRRQEEEGEEEVRGSRLLLDVCRCLFVSNKI
ncbi:unnamed protein product, partial [Phyllotreta striolata]